MTLASSGFSRRGVKTGSIVHPVAHRFLFRKDVAIAQTEYLTAVRAYAEDLAVQRKEIDYLARPAHGATSGSYVSNSTRPLSTSALISRCLSASFALPVLMSVNTMRSTAPRRLRPSNMT